MANLSVSNPPQAIKEIVNTTETEHLISIVTGSLLEQVLTAVVLTLFWLYVNIVNGFLIYVIKKTNTLCENVHYNLLSLYMFCDIIYSNLLCFQILPATIANNVLVFSFYYCSIVSAIAKTIFCFSIHMLGYLAIERLIFFRYPFRYNRYFTKNKIKITSIILLSMPMLYTIVTDAIFVRIPVTTRMYCILPESYRKKANLIVIGFFVGPTLLISICTLISLGLLVKKHQARLNSMDAMATQQPIKNMLTNLKGHMKKLLSISGTFLLAILPGIIIRLVLFPSGATWEEVDTRTDMTVFIWAKIGWFVEMILSRFINPIIYLTHLPDLKRAVWRRLHRQ